MTTILTILIILAAALLVLVVLIQNSKGGGLSANVGVSSQMMGVQRTTDFIEKATWGLMGIIIVLTLASGYFFTPRMNQNPGTDDIKVPTVNQNIPTNQSQPNIPDQPQ